MILQISRDLLQKPCFLFSAFGFMSSSCLIGIILAWFLNKLLESLVTLNFRFLSILNLIPQDKITRDHQNSLELLIFLS